MQHGVMAFTAVFLKSKHGYVGFIEELPHVNSHGSTIEEARRTLQDLVALAFDAARQTSRELVAGKDIVREPFFVALS